MQFVRLFYSVVGSFEFLVGRRTVKECNGPI
jgi:hypothetical protein